MAAKMPSIVWLSRMLAQGLQAEICYKKSCRDKAERNGQDFLGYSRGASATNPALGGATILCVCAVNAALYCNCLLIADKCNSVLANKS